MSAFQKNLVLFTFVLILGGVCGQEADTPERVRKVTEPGWSARLPPPEGDANVFDTGGEKSLAGDGAPLEQGNPAYGYENNLKYFRYQKEDPAVVPLHFKKTELIFGLSLYEEGELRAITEEEWEAFLDDSVRPRFEAFTVFEGRGDYKGITETAKVLLILHHAGEDEEKLHAIAAEYIERFKQDGVMRIDQ